MKKAIILILTILTVTAVYGTHNRAGEILYEHVSGYKYKITLYTYTYTPSAANETRDSLEMQWGDNTTDLIPRVSEDFLPGDYTKNTYIGYHTYSGPGSYDLIMEDPNRNAGVDNIPNSVNVVFAVKTTLLIDGIIGSNSTPQLLNPPYDSAAVGHVFIHNPSAYDKDGDSISYKLATCLTTDGEAISNYSYPEYSDSLVVDAYTGDLIWASPVSEGTYNIAMTIEEWRDGIRIGEVERDMQIDVFKAKNNPPYILELEDTCVEAGTLLEFTVTAIDSAFDDNGTTIIDNVTLTATGGPFEVSTNSSSMEQPVTAYQEVSTVFSWQTDCSHVRKQPYQVIFRAVDDNSNLQLTDYENIQITVVGPAPENLQLQATNNSMLVTWESSVCSDEVVGYKIYRREAEYGYIHDYCEIGVPSYTGYELVGETEDVYDTTFTDNNDGDGLEQGVSYCYMVTAVFPDGVEGYASEEVCDDVIRGIPVITNVSVRNTGSSNGSMYLAWEKPKEYDSINAPGPYKYLLYRSEGMWGSNLQLIDSLFSLDDTTYIDTMLNTESTRYSYMISFYNNDPDNYFLIGSPQIASSVYIDIASAGEQLTLSYDNNVPWNNSDYAIYWRYSPDGEEYRDTAGFELLDNTSSLTYTHTGLVNKEKYCYHVVSTGKYSSDDIRSPLINYSQITCETPIDTIAPCQPDLTVQSICDSLENALSWLNPNDYCCDDAIGYVLYYMSSLDGEWQLLDTIDLSTTTYQHYMESSLAGCYAITAYDSENNESEITSRVCIDECGYYELPNIFTPDGNNINDLYIPLPYQYVEKVDMRIFNRWGTLVFQTDDPDIKWDGRYMGNDKLVSDGIYYYLCDVYEQRLTGIEERCLTGFIYVYAKESDSNQ